jgi:hypothetical protein
MTLTRLRSPACFCAGGEIIVALPLHVSEPERLGEPVRSRAGPPHVFPGRIGNAWYVPDRQRESCREES